jgi:hypothetical protein
MKKSNKRTTRKTRNSSKNKEFKCVFDKDNKCQSKSSGGHIGDIKSIDDRFCGKVIGNPEKLKNDLEFQFISDPNNHKFFKGFLPEYKGICTDDGKKYIVIENLKNGMKKPITIDIKIGFRTYNTKILRLIGKSKYQLNRKIVLQNLIDNNSLSSTRGFRAEGLEGVNTYSKGQLKSMVPYTFLTEYLAKDNNNTALDQIISKLEKLYHIVTQESFHKYLIVGSSLLIVYDGHNPKNVNLKMIDFANSHKYNHSLLDGDYKDYVHGISSLLYELKRYKLIKQYEIDKIPHIVLPTVKAKKKNESLSENVDLSYKSRTKSRRKSTKKNAKTKKSKKSDRSSSN